MKNTTLARGAPFDVPAVVNFVEAGSDGGAPVILVHGLAASLHDWDELLPALAAAGFHAYALDLLGHGDSPKLDSGSYKMKWVFKHFTDWIETLKLPAPPVFIAHSLGAYFCLQFALRYPHRARALVLINPFYRIDQLPDALRHTYRRPRINAFVAGRMPQWIYKAAIDISNHLLGRSSDSASTLSAEVRMQTALDYKRTAPGAFNLPNTLRDLTSSLPRVLTPTLLLWGDRDQTLAPDSFPTMLSALGNARGQALAGGHVIHQANPLLVNRLVLEYLFSLNK